MFVSRSQINQLTRYKTACERIYRVMVTPVEDSHGNVSPYRYDRAHKEILNILAGVGYGRKKVVGIDKWRYECPWEVSK